MQKMVHNVIHANPDGPASAATQFATASNVVDMRYADRCRIVLELTQSGAGTATVTLLQSATNDGSDEKALGFTEYWKNETGASTTQLTRVAATTLTTAGPTTGVNTYIFEVRADELDVDSGFVYLRCNVASISNNTAANLSYDLFNLRYPKGGDAMADAAV